MSESEGPPSHAAGFDQRTDARLPIQAAITYFPFSSQRSFHCSATALNYSRFGLYFESPHPLKIGQYICIRVRQIFEESDSAEIAHLKTLTLAQVRWCVELGKPFEPRFGTGVKYC